MKRQAARSILLLATAVAALAACDSATAPSPGLRSVKGAANIEGDTLNCRSGWVVINGRYECIGEG